MLPTLSTHVAHAYTPRETGSYGGRDHIVVDEPLTLGRLRRKPGDALCKPYRKFWGLYPVETGRQASCKRCLEIAERIGDAR